jgi:purine-binding chemotaxis protein CheW
MTAEESDDNDRMDRASRIREMREGRRGRSRDDESGATDDAEADTPTDEETTTGDDRRGDDTATGDDAPTPAAGDGENVSGEETADDGGFEFENGEPGETGSGDGSERESTGVADTETGDRPSVQSGAAGAVDATDASDAIEQLQTAGSGELTFAIPDQATTVTEDDAGAMIEGADQSVAAARAAVAGRRTHTAEERTRVLEFELGEELFCLDIDYIEEIVELENMTRVPNSPSYVEGVVDLRGQVTAIINPKDALNVEKDGEGELIIVFDSEKVDEQGHLGWVVDEVRQVTPVTEDEVNESPEDEDEEHINGVINRDEEDEFIVWTTPELALNSSSS